MKNKPADPAVELIDFSRNNLDKALSPYLQQHRENPVHWQEWSEEVLAHARETGKALLVSVGYSTCHWCHVMAADSFSDPECTALLNENFVPIKVDREERPDIDRFMMDFLVATTGSGGWPLNVFLSPGPTLQELKPFFALTYASPKPRYGMPGFSDILEQVHSFYLDHRNELKPFQPGRRASASAERGGQEDTGPESIDAQIAGSFDRNNGGFGGQQKFPPHSSLLYSLYRIADRPEESGQSGDAGDNDLDTFVRTTLDAMSLGGLHDHLQGGFFRYCVDPAWTIPHFEKMLYDQAMLLWDYSLAYRIYGSDLYRESALGIFKFLKDSLYDGGLYCAGLDADTNHKEGDTYLWKRGELEAALEPGEFSLLDRSFHLPREGNFEGAIHLLRSEAGGVAADGALVNGARKEALLLSPELRRVCDKMLGLRLKRPQPFRDRKKLTFWNALTGIALVQASRYLQEPSLLEEALSLRENLLQLHYRDAKGVLRGSIDGELLGGRFLEDHASLLLFLTFCYEEDGAHWSLIEKLEGELEGFREKEGWISSREGDFMALPAQGFDMPTPSETAMAELARSRVAILAGRPHRELSFGRAGAEDFRNYGALHTGGYAWLVSSPDPLPWAELPVHSVQIRSEEVQYCYRGSCRRGLPGR